MSNDEIQQGKLLSLILRHKPETIGLQLDANGWADVEELLHGLKGIGRPMSKATLEHIVAENNKQRYSFNENKTKIRANQGHSLSVDLELTPVQPPNHLYHGTTDCYLDSIRQQGIQKQKRQHVHLSKDIITAIKVGQRHGEPVVLVIDSAAMARDGYLFYLSANGVWLCDSVPACYIIEVSHRR